jgi:hypothetical protein
MKWMRRIRTMMGVRMKVRMRENENEDENENVSESEDGCWEET